MPTILDHFDALTNKGLRIIPLRENTKIPLCKGWQYWNLQEARRKLEMFPCSNIGLLLGEIIDVEGDTFEANRVITDLIGDYAHPTYTSTKSVHHLFLTPDPKLRIFKIGAIEFRGYGHQSVLPPSNHHGITYQWLKEFHFPVPEMPLRLHIFYQKHKLEQCIKPGHVQVRCNECGGKRYLHHKRFELEVRAFQELDLKWQCQECRVLDLRPACRLIKASS